MTYKFLILTLILNLDVRLPSLANDLEREVLNIGLNLSIGEFASNQTLCVEYAERFINIL